MDSEAEQQGRGDHPEGHTERPVDELRGEAHRDERHEIGEGEGGEVDHVRRRFAGRDGSSIRRCGSSVRSISPPDAEPAPYGGRDLACQPRHFFELAKVREAAALVAVADDLVAVPFEPLDGVELVPAGSVDVDRAQISGFPPVTAIVAPET
jgi:hypothetical protein